MRALAFDGELKLLPDYPMPAPASGEALIRVLLAGICNTDLEITRGYMGYRGVLGHEFVGLVEESPEPGWVGRRVVGEINCACGACPTCLRGDAPHCPRRTTLGIAGRDGVMAEYCALPARNLHVVPGEVTDEQAVFVEPLAAALEIVDRVHLRPSERAIVVGDGKLGLLVAQVLRLTGCPLRVVGRHVGKLSILEEMGIDVCLERVISPEAPADVVVDCTGTPDGFDLARRLVRPRGRLVLKSTYHGDRALNLSALVVDEVTVIGSRCGPFAPALRLLAAGLVRVESLIEKRMALDEGIAAFARARRRGSLKVLIEP